MGVGPSKGCGGVGGGGGVGGAGLLLGAAVANAAMREANRPDPEEMRRNPERAIFQQMLFGGDPVEVMINLAQAARANQGERPSGGSSTGGSTSGQSNSGRSSRPAARSRQNSPAVTRRTRRRSRHEPDPSSETNDDLNDIRDVAYHFVRRLTRFVRLGGIGQYVTDQTSIRRADVFYEGCSEHQDRTCSVPGHHAAHVVRVRINGNVEIDFPEIFEPLQTFVGHTHFVPQYANVWRGLGGEIDRIQERFLSEISTIDFRGDLTSRVEDILRRLKQAFLDAFESAIRSGRYNEQQVRDLEAVVEAIRDITIRELFEKGREGLNHIPFSM